MVNLKTMPVLHREIKRCFHRSPNWEKLENPHIEALEMIAHKIGQF